MIQNDAELIQRTLDGDQDAFGSLVNKYQKGVHALAWRKIGDFHIAQEITQDTFLRAYEKLGTLKRSDLFVGWLYVIAANLCRDLLRKNPLPEQSLEVTDVSEVEQVSYSRYTVGKQAVEADETRREVVKKLLQKLPESERTVMTLYYLGEMTINAIGEFLGVSPNTVKSRLSRARNRLKKEEDMIRQNLSSFQLPANLTKSIMREVSRTVPIAPAPNKPMLPWALSAASAVLIFLLMGVGTQYLSRFQKPYSLNATSEPAVEIIKAAIVLDTPAKPAVRNQAGSSATPGKSPGSGQKPDVQRFAAALVDEAEVSTPKPQWTQAKGPTGGIVNSFFMTTSGDIYAGTPTTLYKLTEDRRTWRLVNTRNANSLSLQDSGAGRLQMAQYGDMLYLATGTEVLVSVDSGETWNALGTHPEGVPRGFVVTDAGFYLGLIDGIYHSKNGKTSWEALKDGLAAEEIFALAAVQDTVFVGTDNGLYRFKVEAWERLSIGPAEMHVKKLPIYALAVAKHRLYVAAGREFTNWWSLYRSTDFGDTWYTIDPRKNAENTRKQKDRHRLTIRIEISKEQKDWGKRTNPFIGEDSTPADFTDSNVKLIASGKKVMVTGSRKLFYSVNAGETWTSVDFKNRSNSDNIAPPIVMLDAGTFYRGSQFGVYRTTDAGQSWHQFNTGLAGTAVMNLIAFNKRLYAKAMNGFMTSTDGGDTWAPLPMDTDGATVLAEFDGTLYANYARSIKNKSPQIYRFSAERNKFISILGMPTLFGKTNPLNDQMMDQMPLKDNKTLQETLIDIGERDPENGNVINIKKNSKDIDFDELDKLMRQMAIEAAVSTMRPFLGNYAVSGETYYVEYGHGLLRWKPGTTEWYNTGLVDEAQSAFSTRLSAPYDDNSTYITMLSDLYDSMSFKIAVSENTVYVGKRAGHLLQSFDEGETWNDVTADFPFPFVEFRTIAFAGSTVYVATNKGVAYSTDGAGWYKTIDIDGTPLVMEKIVVEGTTVYGITGQHVYRLKENSGTWEQVTPEIPHPVLSFAVDGNTLYVGTASSGVLRFTLDE